MKKLLLILLFPVLLNAQGKIFVSATNALHDSLTLRSIRLAYPTANVSLGTGTVNQNIMDSLKAKGFNMFVRGTAGYIGYNSLADSNRSILFVLPSGSNTHESTGITLGSIVSTGAGMDSNVTGYPIHFYSIDPTGSNLSSYANGYIAGLIAKFSDRFCVTPQRAYYWFTYNKTLGHDGYGKINYEWAVTYYTKYHRKIYIK